MVLALEADECGAGRSRRGRGAARACTTSVPVMPNRTMSAQPSASQNQLGRLDLERVLRAEDHAPVGIASSTARDDRAGGVAEEGRPLAEQVVDVVVAVHVAEPGALAAGEEDLRGVEPDVGVDAAGNAARGALAQRPRCWAVDVHRQAPIDVERDGLQLRHLLSVPCRRCGRCRCRLPVKPPVGVCSCQ